MRPGRTPRRTRRVFDEARQLTTWHYQWMILNEFLPLFIGQAGRRHPPRAQFYRPEALHPRRVPGRRLPLRPHPGAAVVPGQPRRRRGTAFFGMIFDPAGEGQPTRRPARRRARAAALHRLADVLRLRRTGRTARRRAAEQADRHDLDAAVPPAARASPRATADLAAPAQPAAPRDLVAAVRAGDRAR